MADIVNLRTRRKQATRDEARAKASLTAARHGESHAVKSLTTARAEKADRDLSAHRRDRDESEAPR